MPDVPAGTWTVSAWHERYGKQTRQVTVPASGVAKADFVFEERGRPPR